ncbi:type VI secretion system tip protein TssI/VgrG [Achromobacter agilis]|uniref:Actin cross-linking toxin VgrG1 n=1 Tax=Achromobacter agilis TaxID=1353888 RepID=A0A446C999_9BURK|nr:type VI secretion system tip protein TssI/VgrG [Achromobacter agilis]SSW64487.1 Actin cross-linking toxin VgrG1 [Achromobacter agilis]
MIDRSSTPAGFSSLDAASLSQNARLLQVRTPLGDALTVERMQLREGVSELFALTLDCLASSAELDVEPLLGKEISVSLLLADGSRRLWHAVVEGVDSLGADGGLARYRLHAAPWLATLRLRRDSFLYQDKPVTDILSEVFADYPLASFAFEITEPPAPRPVRTQYRETDLAFVLRLMAEAGLSFRFDHQQGEQQDGAAGGAQHRLVVFDAGAAHPANPAATLRFHRSDATETEDSVTRFGAARAIQPNAVTRVAWNDRALLAHGAHAQSGLDAGSVPPLEDYDYDGHGRYTDDAGAEQRAARSLLAHEARMVRFDGGGTARQMAPGHDFTLTQHDRYAEGAGQAVDEMGGNQYTLLHVLHEAANNLGSQAAQVLGASDLEHGTYHNTFSAQPVAAALLPPWIAKPTAPEGLVAVVVTAQDEAISSGRDLRVKVQFPWQRGRRPLPGGLPHRSHGDDEGNAPGNDSSGTWLRVAGAQAGPNWGAHHLPRQGTEVVVEFLDGDIDQPVVVAQLYNDADLPPWSAGVDAEANHPGTLSGWHSQGLDGEGHSQWLFDDTSGQVRTRLSSSAAASQLGLGHLVKQAADESSRGEWRGTGFELRSDAWTVVRSGQGMLLSANARSNAGSTLADAKEALALMRGAQNAAQRINDAAAQRQARELTATGQYDAQIKAIDPKADGRYPGSVGGQQAIKASGGGRTGTEPVERIDGARMLIDAPSSLNLSTPASTILHASENLHVTAQADGHIAARQTFASASGKSTSLFVQDGGLRAIAANAPVSLHAHTDMLEMLAGQDITVTSTTDSIEILANQRVTLQAANGSIVLDGGDILFKGPGMFSVKGASHSLIGPGSDAAALPALPSTQVGDPMIVTAELLHRPKAQALAALQASSSQGANAAAAGAAASGAATATASADTSLAGRAAALAGQAGGLASSAAQSIKSASTAVTGAVDGAKQAGTTLMAGAADKAGELARSAANAVTPSLMGGPGASLGATAGQAAGTGATSAVSSTAGNAMGSAAANAAGTLASGVAANAGATAQGAASGLQGASATAGAGAFSGAADMLSAAGDAAGKIGEFVNPVMAQALTGNGDRGSAIGSAVNGLLGSTRAGQYGLPAIAGAIMRAPSLDASALPAVASAVLQSPAVSGSGLPGVAAAVLRTPGFSPDMLPSSVTKALQMAGVLPNSGTPPFAPPGTPRSTPGATQDGAAAQDAGEPAASNALTTYRGQTGAHLQFVNFAEEDAFWNDGTVLISEDRQTAKPKIHVRFSKAAVHKFSIKVVAGRDNIAYSQGEKGRHAAYRDPNGRTFQYQTDPDGTKVVNDISLPAAGLNTYTFEVRDARNQRIATETVETARRLYIQELVMPGPQPMARAQDNSAMAAEYRRHGIDVAHLPARQGAGNANYDVDQADADLLQRQARAIYDQSEGPDHEPYTIVVCHVERLAFKAPQHTIYRDAYAGPGERKVYVPLVGGDGASHFLWYGIDNDPWFLNATYEYTDASGQVRRIPIPPDRVFPVPQDQGKPLECPGVGVIVDGLTPTRTLGKIHLNVQLMDSAATGVAFPGTNLLCVAARTPWDPADPAGRQQTLVHEIGHLIYMVASGPAWAQANGYEDDDSHLDASPYFYSPHGRHCHFGLAKLANVEDYAYESGSCVMFGISGAPIRFCPTCARAVRKVDFSNGWPSF